MKKHGSAELDELLQTENQQLLKLNEIVFRAIEEEKLISQKLYAFEDQHPPFASKLADRMATFGGSWLFIVTFCLILFLWILLNVYWIQRPFDPYPFILLNLVLSTVAAMQAPVIMMSQNRKEEKDRQRAVNDYMINLKSEIELRNLHQKIDLLITEQMKTLFEIQKVQMELMEEIRDGIAKAKKEKTETSKSVNGRNTDSDDS
jgi:uncharacterized membrane protein